MRTMELVDQLQAFLEARDIEHEALTDQASMLMNHEFEAARAKIAAEFAESVAPIVRELWSDVAWSGLSTTTAAVEAVKPEIEYAAVEYARTKLEGLFRHSDLFNIMKTYKGLPESQRVAWQDIAADVLMEVKPGHEPGFKPLFDELNRDKAQRLNTPAAMKAKIDHAALTDTLQTAHRLTKDAIGNMVPGASDTANELLELFGTVKMSDTPSGVEFRQVELAPTKTYEERFGYPKMG